MVIWMMRNDDDDDDDARDGDGDGDEERVISYRSHFLQDRILHATFLEINPRCLNHILDDLLVHIADLRVRHLDGIRVVVAVA